MFMSVSKKIKNSRENKWVAGAFDEKMFCELLREVYLPVGSANEIVNRACNVALPVMRHCQKRKPSIENLSSGEIVAF